MAVTHTNLEAPRVADGSPGVPWRSGEYSCTARTVSAKCLALRFSSLILSWTERGRRMSLAAWPSCSRVPNKASVEVEASEPDNLRR